MNKGYSASGPNASGTALKTAVALRSTAALRHAFYHGLFNPWIGPNTTDFQYVMAVRRFTAQGTSAASAPTPIAIDGGDIASLTVIEWTDSAEPTYATSDANEVGGNQRAAPQWQQYDGREIYSVAGAATGIGAFLLQTTPATAFQVGATLFWKE